MYCQKCGNEIKLGGGFCSSCGAAIEPQQQYQSQPEVNSENSYQWQPSDNQSYAPSSQTEIEYGESKSSTSLTMGILSIVLCWLFGIPGIVLGTLAISNGKIARQTLDESHYSYWSALAGIITGGIGLALSIIFTISFLISFIAGVSWSF
ncbi:MAG: hypothetical protein LBO63_00620 [Oscillospiraceae bacterium]|jgi:predicted ATP-dependent serine protease|nr:hypothetical protein [Oscillospiraceae bacterium]